MYDELIEFWSEWVGIGSHNITLPVPFTNGGSIELIELLSVLSIGLIVYSAVWLIIYVVKSILSTFRSV